jgi:hypothetical protein
LLLAGGYDEISTRQRRKVCDEWVLSHQIIQVKVCWWWNCLGARWHVHHLPCAKVLKLAGILHQGNPCASFQDKQSVTARAFQDYRRAGHGDGDTTRRNAAAAGILRNA